MDMEVNEAGDQSHGRQVNDAVRLKRIVDALGNVFNPSVFDQDHGWPGGAGRSIGDEVANDDRLGRGGRWHCERQSRACK